MSISYRVAKRFELRREKLIADFLAGIGTTSESEAAFFLSNEFGINPFDARDLIEEYRELESAGHPSEKDVLPLISKYATAEKVACGCGCGCDCYNKCDCGCGCH
jgi:hypothetical protein